MNFPQCAAFSFGDIGFVFKILGHMARTMGPDFPLTLKKAITAESAAERGAALITPISFDPYVIRRLFTSIEGDYKFVSETTLIPRDFDLWVRCATQLGNRGDETPYLFDRCFQGSALNSQPERYGKCPYGKWEVSRLIEPHFVARDQYSDQVGEMEAFIDEYMSTRLNKPIEVGKLLRLLVWDLYCITSYGEGPSEGTKHMLQLFDGHLPEFDYIVRLSSAGIRKKWSDSLTAKIYSMGDWCWRVALDRVRNIDKYADKTDVLTTILKDNLDNENFDLARMEGALRGVFTGGMNNCHCAISGTLVHEAKSKGAVSSYLSENPENIEHILREALRLYTAIPAARFVREEDEFELDGKLLTPGTSVVLSTYGVDTDPRSWKDELKFDASRFENTSEIGYMCQRGFAPLGAAAELGGRPCGARYHAEHMLRVIIRKLLTDYQFEEVGRSRGFEFKQSAGTSMYAGKCIVKITKRS